MSPYTFLLDTYATERLKTLSVWSRFDEKDPRFRPEPRARTPLAADASARRLERMGAEAAEWFAGETRFFDVTRTRAWVLTRRIAHSAHHRPAHRLPADVGPVAVLDLRPDADTGGLFQQGAPVIYRYESVEALLAAGRG